MMSVSDIAIGSVALAGQAVFFALITWATYRHFNGDRPTMGFTLVKVLSAAAFLGLSGLWFWQGPAPVGLSVASLGLCVAAHGLFLITWRQTRARALDVVFSQSRPDVLLTDGVYGWVRNPFYSSYLVYWAAWVPLLDGALAAFVALVVFVLVYIAAARQEERCLADMFGVSYAQYKTDVPRFVPLGIVRRFRGVRDQK